MKASQRGFTLVELLIAVLLLVLVTAMLFDGLRVATAHLDRASGKLDRSSQIALVENFMRAQLADAQPLPTTGGAAAIVDFAGTPDHVAFVSPAPSGVAFGGLQVLTIGLAADHGPAGGALVADWRPYRDLPDAAPAAPSRPLLDHVRQVVFAYFGSTAPNEPPDWHDSWEEMNALPLLVRLSVVFTDGQTLPELIVALRLSGGVGAGSRG